MSDSYFPKIEDLTLSLTTLHFTPFCEIKLLSHSFLRPHGNKSSFSLTRLQLSSCITLSISPLCFPFQIFFNPWTGRFASLKAKGVKGHKPIEAATSG